MRHGIVVGIAFWVVVMLLCDEAAKAQWQSVGLRVGGGVSTSAEVAMQWQAGPDRVEGTVGWLKEGHHVDQTLAALWQWYGVARDGFEWYAGIGVHAAWRQWESGYGDPSLVPALAAQVGLQYDFDRVPLSITIDMRPRFEMPAARLMLGEVAVGLRLRIEHFVVFD